MLRFSVMADVPYNDIQIQQLLNDIEKHNALSNSEFMLHLGDITNDGNCEEHYYSDMASYLNTLDVPSILVIGDNEWIDCEDQKQGRSFWLKYFVGFENNKPNHLKIERQDRRPENVAWVTKGILMLGVTLPSEVKGIISEEFEQLHRDNVEWMEEQFARHGNDVRAAILFFHARPAQEKHASFAKSLRKIQQDFRKPMLILHGDGHEWTVWKVGNATRVQLDHGGKSPPIQVIVLPKEKDMFIINQLQFEKYVAVDGDDVTFIDQEVGDEDNSDFEPIIINENQRIVYPDE